MRSKVMNARIAAAACLFISLIVASQAIAAKDNLKDVEIVESDIRFEKNEFPRLAYLYADIKNGASTGVANLTLEISYFDEEGFPINKAVIKNALYEPIGPGQTKKYKIKLKGRGFNDNSDQYPYSYKYSVGSFDVKVLSVQPSRK